MSDSSRVQGFAAVTPTGADGRRFDVFLSHNSRDKPFVERIAERLKRVRLEPWLDAWQLVPGVDWQQGLAEGLAESRSCAVFIGPSDLGAWAQQEVRVAVDRAAKDGNFRVFLVLLPGVPERYEPAAELSPFLLMRTWVDFRGGLDDARAFHALASAIKGVPLGPAVPLQPDASVCPYRGLEVFEAEHAEFFFGRDPDVQRLLEKLKGTRFLAVLGASGSGKSSLVRAGLVPALTRSVSSDEVGWQVAVMRPGAHPAEALAAQLVRLGADVPMQQTLDGLTSDARTLHLAGSLALAERPPGTRLLLVIDQFEEVFTLCRDEQERSAFFANLLYAATVPDGLSGVLLTMRADFYHRCGAYPELAQQLAANQYLVSPILPEGLRQAVEEPARRVGLTFEPGLVATILEDVADQPGALPLLEHALLEVWRLRAGGILTLAGYRESGGVQGAIAKRAEQVFESLAPDEQELARRTFLRLTQPGEGTEDTRRRAQLSELEGPAAEITRVLAQLVNARLVTTTRGEAAGGEVIEVAHEALIRGWPRLRVWIDEDRAGLRVHRRLTVAAQEWEHLQGDEDSLFRGSRLVEALEWRDVHDEELNDLERAFLAAAVALRDKEAALKEEQRQRELAQAHALAAEQQGRTEEQRRSARRFRRLALGLLVLLLAALAATVFAVAQRREAVAERNRAVPARIAAQSEATLVGAPPLALLLAVEAQRAMAKHDVHVPAADEALQRALAYAGGTVLGKLGETTSGAAFSHDNRRLALGLQSGAVQILDLSPNGSAARATVVRGPKAPVGTLAFSQSGEWLVVAHRELDTINENDRSVVRLWKLGGYARPVGPVRLADEGSKLNAALVSRDGRWLVTVSTSADSLRLWDLTVPDAGSHFVELPIRRPDGNQSAISSDGKWLVSVSGVDGKAHVWSLGERGPSGPPKLLPGRGAAVVTDLTALYRPYADPADLFVVTRTQDGASHAWKLAGAAALRRPVTMANTRQSLGALTASLDGRLLVGQQDDDVGGVLRLWKVSGNRAASPSTLRRSLDVYSVGFSPDGRWAIATGTSQAGVGGWVSVWNVANRKPVHVLRHDGVFGLSKDRRWLATVDPVTSAVQIWDLSIKRDLAGHAVTGNAGSIWRLDYSSDGRWLIASGAKMIQLLELSQLDRDSARTIRELGSPEGFAVGRWAATLRGHEDAVEEVLTTTDGRRLITISSDGTSRQWDLEARAFTAASELPRAREGTSAGSDVWIALACRTAGRNLSRTEWQRYLPDQTRRRTCPEYPLDSKAG